MTRNIRKRVEVAVPIYDDYIKHRILNFMDIMFADDTKIRKLNSDKSYSKVENTENKNAQEILIDIAKENSEKEICNQMIIELLAHILIKLYIQIIMIIKG